MPKRRKIGTVYVHSPSQLMRSWFIANFSKILFSILLCIAYLFVLYVFVGIVKFLGSEMASMWEKETPVMALYNSPYCLPVKIGGMIGVFLYVFRDKLTKR